MNNTTTTIHRKLITEAIREYEEFHLAIAEEPIRIDGAGRNTAGEIVIVAFDTYTEQHLIVTFTLDGSLHIAPCYKSTNGF